MTKQNNNINAKKANLNDVNNLNEDKMKENDNSAHKPNTKQPSSNQSKYGKSSGSSGLDSKKLRPHELAGHEYINDGLDVDGLDDKRMGGDRFNSDRLDVDGLAGDLGSINNHNTINQGDNNSESDSQGDSPKTSQAKPHQHSIADYLSVTDAAKAKLLENLSLKLKSKADKPDKADIMPEGIVISTPKRGCNGREYKLDYAYYGINLTDNDEVVHLICKDENEKDVPLDLFVDLNSSLFLFGCIMDYEDNGVEFGFTFINPNEKGKCGCGESFNV